MEPKRVKIVPSAMPALVDDALLDHFVVRGTLEELPGRIDAKYGRHFDRMAAYYPLSGLDPDRLRQFCSALS